MEEILRDSEKGQSSLLADCQSSSDTADHLFGDVAASQTAKPSLQLVLDPSSTGTVLNSYKPEDKRVKLIMKTLKSC